ncbi:MAG: hypothetical protein ABIJ59_10910 [Pseudomonadota bacterium]
MEQKKPIDLKDVAKRFTEKYYPQWLSRVDRIWEMLEKVDPNSLFSESENSQSQQGNALGITGDVEPKFKECISGIAILAFTCRDVKDKDSISADEIRKRISIVPAGLKLTPILQSKLENILAEMLPSVIEESTIQPKNKGALNLNEHNDKKRFVVYMNRSSGFGVEKILVAEDDLHSHYLLNKNEYDIIVYQHNVEIKSVAIKDGTGEIQFRSIELYANIFHLLILFLKYKDEFLPYLALYHCAWKGGAEYKANVTDSDDIIDDLKTGVSSLRKRLKSIENFIIPNAKKTTNAYICKGGFKFCLILRHSMDQSHTLEVD